MSKPMRSVIKLLSKINDTRDKEIFNMKVKILMCLCLLLTVCTFGEASKNKATKRLFRQATKGMNSRDVNILRRHKCMVPNSSDPKRHEIGVARWTEVVFKCRNLQQNLISAVICDKTCIDPVTCKKMKKLKAEPVSIGKALTDRNNVTRTVNIPIACSCVPRKKKPLCTRNDTHRQRRQNSAS